MAGVIRLERGHRGGCATAIGVNGRMMPEHEHGLFDPWCLACQSKMRRVNAYDLFPDSAQREICRGLVEPLATRDGGEWLCDGCQTIYPIRFEEAPSSRHATTAKCPECGYSLIVLGDCIKHAPEVKIYCCSACTRAARAVSIFGFVKPDGVEHRFFARLSKSEVFDRLAFLEDANRLIGAGGESLTAYRDMFIRDSVYALDAISEANRHFRFILAYANDYDHEEELAARRENTQRSLDTHEFNVPPCPNPRLFKRMVLRPEKVHLEIVPRRDVGDMVLIGAASGLLLGLALALFTPYIEISLVMMVAAFLVAAVGLEIRTTGAEILCEGGEITIRYMGLLTGQGKAGLSRIQEVAVQFYSAGPQVHTYVDVTDPDAHAPPESEHAVVEGLSVRHHDRRELLVIRHKSELVLWAGRALVEAAKAQGIYCGEVR